MMRWNARVLGIAIAAIVVLAAAGYFAARSGPAFGQSLTIGYVDMARALDAHPGRASAEAMARLGARVVTSSRTAEACEAVAKDIRKNGGEASVMPCNV